MMEKDGMIVFTEEQLVAHDQKEYGKSLMCLAFGYGIMGFIFYRRYKRKLEKLMNQ